jgi:hypothetical protein
MIVFRGVGALGNTFLDTLIITQSAETGSIVYGCMDRAALNYNPLATVSDNSCRYPNLVYGCMDSTATNYNPQANAWSPNFRCVYDILPVFGCTDRFAENFNPNANTNDGSCVYRRIEEPITGCMDTLALNYNPVATIPGRDCIFEVTGQETVYGCMDLKALNYNPNATEQDNSCVYADEENTFNGIITEEPDDVVSTRPVERCDLDAGLSIVSAFISSVNFISDLRVTANWVIEQEDGNIVSYAVEYTISGPGNIMFYLSIVCNNGVLRGSAADVTGYTVSAAYDVGEPTSINICQPEAAANNLVVYPNPFTDQLNVLVKGAKAVNITLYSVTGTQLASYSNLNEVQIATSKLPAGIYVVKVIADGKMETVTVVKR